MFMRTERLFLRPVFTEDWREVFREIADDRVVRMLARAPWPYRPSDARAFCARARQEPGHKFAITLPELAGAPIIGMVGIEPDGEGTTELGYWIGRRWQGRGYASEAVQGVLQIAAAIGIDTVEAGHFLDNPASAQVLRKAGFVETGEVRPTKCLGRGGEMVLARRYAKMLREPALVDRPAAA